MRIEQAVAGDLDQIIEVLDEATLTLLNKGIPQWKYPWYQETVRKELKYQYVVKEYGRIIAVFSIKPLGDNNYVTAGKADYYLYRIAILPEYQGKGVGHVILRHIQRRCHKEHKNIYLDCYYENKKLKSLYEKEGFRYQGNYQEKDYYISVYRYLWKDTPQKNRLRNEMVKRKKELRLLRRIALAVLALAFVLNINFFLNFLGGGIQMTPGVVVGEFTYWEDDNIAIGKSGLPVDAKEAGKVKKIVPGDEWPDRSLEAVGIPKNLRGEKVYLSSDNNFAYIYNRNKREYLIFNKELQAVNNNYSNGLYDKLLKACAAKGTIPIMEVPGNYTIEQAKEDKLPTYRVEEQKLVTEGSDYVDTFIQQAENKGKAFIRIARFLDDNKTVYMDIFYYKENYYFYLSDDPDRYNGRFTYLQTGDIVETDLNITAYVLCQSEQENLFNLLSEGTEDNILMVFVMLP